MSYAQPSSRQPAGTGTPSSAPVFEYICLFSHDLRRKQKRWQDGRLKYHTFNKRVMVYDERGNLVGDTHWRADYDLDEGEEFQLERGSAIVQVSECVARNQQDLSELLDKRAHEKENRRNSAAARHSTTPTTRRPSQTSSAPQDHFQLRHRPLESIVGTPTGHHGRAHVPSESPFEQRHAVQPPAEPRESPDSRPTKRRRQEEPPPSKSGYATALFGATLTLSATPSNSAPLRHRPPRRVIDLESPAVASPLPPPPQSQTNSRSFVQTPVTNASNSSRADKPWSLPSPESAQPPEHSALRHTFEADQHERSKLQTEYQRPKLAQGTSGGGNALSCQRGVERSDALAGASSRTTGMAGSGSRPVNSATDLQGHDGSKSRAKRARKPQKLHTMPPEPSDHDASQRGSLQDKSFLSDHDRFSSASVNPERDAGSYSKAKEPRLEIKIRSRQKRGLLVASNLNQTGSLGGKWSDPRLDNEMSDGVRGLENDTNEPYVPAAADVSAPSKRQKTTDEHVDDHAEQIERDQGCAIPFQAGIAREALADVSNISHASIGPRQPDPARQSGNEALKQDQTHSKLPSSPHALFGSDEEDFCQKDTGVKRASDEILAHNAVGSDKNVPPKRRNVSNDSEQVAECEKNDTVPKSKPGHTPSDRISTNPGQQSWPSCQSGILQDNVTDEIENDTDRAAQDSAMDTSGMKYSPEKNKRPSDSPDHSMEHPVGRRLRRRQEKSSSREPSPLNDEDDSPEESSSRASRRRAVKPASKATSGPRLAKLARKTVKSKELLGFTFQDPTPGPPLQPETEAKGTETTQSTTAKAKTPCISGPPDTSASAMARSAEDEVFSLGTAAGPDSVTMEQKGAVPKPNTTSKPRSNTPNPKSKIAEPDEIQRDNTPSENRNSPVMNHSGSNIHEQALCPAEEHRSQKTTNTNDSKSTTPNASNIGPANATATDTASYSKADTATAIEEPYQHRPPLQSGPSHEPEIAAKDDMANEARTTAHHCEMPVESASSTARNRHTFKRHLSEANMMGQADGEPKIAPVRRAISDAVELSGQGPAPPAVLSDDPKHMAISAACVGSLAQPRPRSQVLAQAQAQAPPAAAPAKISNPATRGRKAALKSDAAGQVPKAFLPPSIQQGPQVIYVDASGAPLAAHQPAKPAGQEKPAPRKMKFPGFAPASNAGPWSKEAYDLLGMERPV